MTPSLLRAFIRAKTSRAGRFLRHDVSPGPSPLPRTIWMLWDKGEAEAPPLVRHCISTWRDRNPGWRVEVLDGAVFREHPDLAADLPRLGVTKTSNRLRNRLLLARGGVWADATTVCASPLDHWLPILMDAGIFLFDRPEPDRLISNWFIAAEPSNPLLARIEAAYETYWRHPMRRPYYGYHYTVEWLWRSDPGFRRGFARMPRVSAIGSHRLQRWLMARDGSPPPDLRGIPIHKLNWRDGFDPEEVRRLVG